MELPLSTPAPDHLEFDLLCLEIEEFEPLPSLPADYGETESSSEESSLDGQILAGLVTP
ncbi:MAG TPA: hypothetical protein VKR21_02075 [Solirubrobacteraceae bacterium]|nr:hypothetical protein [Solirubrobacteraceae bacterium]